MSANPGLSRSFRDRWRVYAAGQRSIDNLGLLSALFDLVEGSVLPSLPVVSRALSGQLPGTSRSSSPVSSVQSFNSNAGKYLLAYLHVQQVL